MATGLLIAFVAGIIFNRIRGGGLSNYRITADTIFAKHNKVFNDIAFGLLMALIEHGDFTLEYFNDAPLYGAAMFYGRHFGWGNYIGAIIKRTTSHFTEGEVDFIDNLIKPYLHRPVLYGFLGLTLRGMLWAAFIALAFNNLLPVLGGALMGAAYVAVITLCGDTEDKRMRGWGYGEHVFGGIFWATCALALIW